MLDLLARHSRIDITVKAKGDLHIDHHHTTEDVGIALGQAVKQALGDMKGITRYADVHVPMDEALTRVAIDISGRPFLVFKAEFVRDKIGEFDTELIQEWFQAFAMNAGITLHAETLYGTNDHHIAESCFKGLAAPCEQLSPSICARRTKYLLQKVRSAADSITGLPGSVRGMRGAIDLDHRTERTHLHRSAPLPRRRDHEKRSERVFVRDGFHFWAFLLAPLWLLLHRLWLALVIYVFGS